MQMSKLQGAQIQMFKHIYIEPSHAPVHVQMHIQTRWLEGGLWLWQASLSASRSPRLWERMGRNAKETRRSQAYSSKVEVGGWGGRWRLEVKEKGDWMLFPMLILPVCRDHMCVNQALEHPVLLPILPILVSLPAVSLSLFLSLFFYCPDFQVFLLLCGFNYKLLLCLGTNKDLQTKHKFPSKWEHVVDFDDHPLHPL